MTTVLVIVVVVLAIWVASLKRQLREQHQLSTPCQRCAAIGTTRPYTGPPSQPAFYRQALDLCFECRNAQDSFIGHRLMLETEERFHFGRGEIVKQAEHDFGARAPDMLALLLVAREDMDKARRILTSESFEQARPWLEENLCE